jgi:hypothetical protein
VWVVSVRARGAAVRVVALDVDAQDGFELEERQIRFASRENRICRRNVSFDTRQDEPQSGVKGEATIPPFFEPGIGVLTPFTRLAPPRPVVPRT